MAGNTTEHVGTGAELLLQAVNFSDSGTYVCTANNSKGMATASVTLTVTGQSKLDNPKVHQFKSFRGFFLYTSTDFNSMSTFPLN